MCELPPVVNWQHMGHMWAIHPGDEDRLAGAADLAAKLQGEIMAIESLGDEAVCRLCGVRTSLTAEHTPSKKAGNPSRAIQLAIDYVRSVATGRVSWTARKIQGITAAALCRPCNSNTGAWYNPAYIKLVRHCQGLAREENAGRVCDVDLEVHPQRVLKQAMTSIIATSQPGLTTRHPDLWKFLTHKESRGPIAPARLWFFLVASRTTRTTGLAVSIQPGRGTGLILTEFSSWPLGWIATFGGPSIDGAVEVSEWSNVGFHDKVRVTLKVPCQWVVGRYPADFRPPRRFRDWPEP